MSFLQLFLKPNQYELTSAMIAVTECPPLQGKCEQKYSSSENRKNVAVVEIGEESKKFSKFFFFTQKLLIVGDCRLII